MSDDLRFGEMVVELVDGSPVVRRADPTILVSLDLLREGQADGTITFQQGTGEYLFAGQVSYRLRALEGDNAVMDKVRDLR